MNKIIITLLCSICFGVSLSSCSHDVKPADDTTAVDTIPKLRLVYRTEGMSTHEKLDGHYELVDSDNSYKSSFTICEDLKKIEQLSVSSESDSEQRFIYHIEDVHMSAFDPGITVYNVIRNDGFKCTIFVDSKCVSILSGSEPRRAWDMNIKEREIY